MGTYDDLEVGRRIDGPAVTIPDDVLELVRGLGGYTHPIFTDPDHVREHTPFAATPVPGALIPFLLGGLAEQTDVFDETTIALIGMDDTRFTTPAFPGDRLHLTMEVVDRSPTRSGDKGTVRLRWTATNQDDAEVCSTVATFLFRLT